MAMPVTKRCPQPGQRQAFGGTQGQGLARRGPGTHTGWRLGELFISLTVNKELASQVIDRVSDYVVPCLGGLGCSQLLGSGCPPFLALWPSPWAARGVAAGILSTEK